MPSAWADSTIASTQSDGVADASRAWMRWSACPGANVEQALPWLHMHAARSRTWKGGMWECGVDTTGSF